MPRTRRCCCCNDVYSRGPVLVKIRVDSKGIGSIANTLTVSNADKIEVDYVNEDVYFRSNSSNVERVDKSLSNRFVLIPAGSTVRAAGGLGVDPATKQIWYGAVNVPAANTAYLRRCDFNGANDTLLLTYAPIPTTGPDVFAVAIARVEQIVFFMLRKSTTFTGENSEIHRCDFNGGADTILWSSTADEAVTTQGIDVDNQNKKLIWTNTYNIPAGGARFGYKIRSMNFDGSGQTTLFDSGTLGSVADRVQNGGARWSHKLQRIFFWYGTTGFRSMKTDGTDLKTEVLNANWPNQDQPISMSLGCGYEKFGPTSLA